MKPLIAYHGDAQLKKDFLREIKKHEKADAIVQGTYGTRNGTWKGCAVACSLRSLAIVKGKDLVTEYSQHARYETDLGIPQIIAKLEDRIFEGLSKEDAKNFPFQFASAIQEGADLSLVWPKFAVWLLIDEQDGVLKYAKTERSIASIKRVAELYQKQIDGEKIERQTWKNATATDAVLVAVATATDAVLVLVVATATDAVLVAVAATVGAAYAAREIHYKKSADKIIQLLKEAPFVSRKAM